MQAPNTHLFLCLQFPATTQRILGIASADRPPADSWLATTLLRSGQEPLVLDATSLQLSTDSPGSAAAEAALAEPRTNNSIAGTSQAEATPLTSYKFLCPR